ncbi:zinc finger RNA-binding protein 2 isoform X2 [Adelges cooleyi]|uniref:zinc finger RNA-binding protein 2 isoform X2 n=1 Tax=Adelges cooleyi TaxID=133065 RepID=UPI0021802E8C|nr:zinc finger RNA-binding protein 2 isoform X2 [Adelges cooleyi]
MAANNYFGFTHNGTQYASATGYQAPPQAGYAVPPATYTTPRAAATAYDVASYQTAAATQSAYAKAAYNNAAYDTRQNTYAQQQTYQTQPQYAPYQAVTSYTTGVVAKKQCQANAAAYATSSAMQQKVTYPIQQQSVASTPNQSANKAASAPGYEAAVYSNTNFPTQNQNQVRPNNAQKRQNWFKKNTSGFAGGAKGGNRVNFANRSQEIHYCEVCRISCAGTQTYKEHLDGQKHKKREANAKISTTPSKPSNNPATKVFHCDLCDVSCTGADSYAAHLRGSKHQKVYNLHTKLGKPIPPPNIDTAVVSKTSAPKVNFIPAGKLGTVVKNENNAVTPSTPVKIETKTAAPAITPTVTTNETDVILVGMEYIEEIKDEAGKMVSFNCKLCECKFNDPNAKEMHMKGRRHRLSYKKKVDPSLIVELKPSWFEARRMQKDKHGQEGNRVRDERSNFWVDRFMEMDDRYSWDDRRRYQEEVEYYDWCRSVGPRGMGMGPPPLFGPPALMGARPPPPHMMKFGLGVRPPQMHNSMRRYDTVDDKHIMAKHSSLFPKQTSLKTLQKAVSDTEKALKLVAEDLMNTVPEIKVEALVTEPSETAKELQTKKTPSKEDGRDGSMFTFTNEKDDTKVVKMMTGSMRVGALSKGLLLVNENEVDIVIICSTPPTLSMLNSIVTILPEKLKVVAKDDNYVVNKYEAEARLAVEILLEEEKFVVNVAFTSPSVREAILNAAEGESEHTEPVAIVPGEHVLDKTKCLEALAAIRHAKWFQAKLASIPNGPLIIRILKDFIMREPTWHPFTLWKLELFVERVLTSAFAPNSPNSAAGLSPAEGLKRFFEAIASGALLPGVIGVHLLDPCEKDPVDALASLSVQQREDITLSAQNMLRLIAFRQVNKVLGMELLPIKQQRMSTRKRRREGSMGEGNETEDGENKKKDKKEDDATNSSVVASNDDIAAEDTTNGEVANMETEKVEAK